MPWKNTTSHEDLYDSVGLQFSNAVQLVSITSGLMAQSWLGNPQVQGGMCCSTAGQKDGQRYELPLAAVLSLQLSQNSGVMLIVQVTVTDADPVVHVWGVCKEIVPDKVPIRTGHRHEIGLVQEN
jgi:hypothetical protein